MHSGYLMIQSRLTHAPAESEGRAMSRGASLSCEAKIGMKSLNAEMKLIIGSDCILNENKHPFLNLNGLRRFGPFLNGYGSVRFGSKFNYRSGSGGFVEGGGAESCGRAVLNSEVRMMKSTKSLITLAVACLLAVPAFSMPWKDGAGCGGRFDQLNLTEEEMENMTLAELRELRQESNGALCPMNQGAMNQGAMNQGAMNQCRMNQGRTDNGPMGRGFGDCLLLMTDLTPEEMESMTLGELEDLRQQKMDELSNMTAEEIEALREEKRAQMDNMTIAELREVRQNGFDRPFIGGGACPLAADLTVEELEGMTLAQIEDLRQQKINQLNNMTISEIEEMNEQKRAQMDNLTIAELRERMEVCEILNLGPGCAGCPQGCCGDFGMGGGPYCCTLDGQGCQKNYCAVPGAGMQKGRGASDGQMNGPVSGGAR